MKIKHVYGNVLKVDIPLTIKIHTLIDGHDSEHKEDFYPDPGKSCIIELISGNSKYSFNASIRGNVVHFEDDGKIRPGLYGVSVKCFDSEGKPYRYYEYNVIHIVYATIDAGIEAGIEFNAETYTLNGAVFISYGGEQVQSDSGVIETPVNTTDATLPITTLTCEVGKYYRIDVAVDTLAVTLPAMTDLTTVRTVVIYLTAGTTPAITISSTAVSGGTAPDVYYQDGYEIKAGKTYEVSCLYNGAAWVVGALTINTGE